VDADFWALVCEDEEWLDAEFDAIVGAAWETPWRSGRLSRIGVAWPGRGMWERELPGLSSRGGPGNGPADGGAGNGDRPGTGNH